MALLLVAKSDNSKLKRIYILALALSAISRSDAQSLSAPTPITLAPQQSVSASGTSLALSANQDGRYVVFCSNAKDLILSQPNTKFVDMFLRDTASNSTRLLSVDPAGLNSGNGNSAGAIISSNGQFVVFTSMASNLTANSTGKYPEVYVRDTVAGVTEMVSVSPSANPGQGGYAYDCDITPDGRYIVFTSSHTNLTAEGSRLNSVNLFLRERVSQTTQLLTFQATNTMSNSLGRADSPTISDDGQRIVFGSYSADLVVWPATLATAEHVYLFDRATGTNSCLSLDAQQLIGGIPGTSSNGVISADGSAAAFFAFSNATFLIYETLSNREPSVVSTSADPAYAAQLSKDGRHLLYRDLPSRSVLAWDAQTGSNQIVSVAIDGTTNGDALPAAMSADGSRVVFLSNATNLTADTPNGFYQIYVRDIPSQTTRLVSTSSNGPTSSDQIHSRPMITADGARVIFSSADPSFVPGDNNRSIDAFVWSWDSGNVELLSACEPTRLNATGFQGVLPNIYSTSSNSQFVAFAASDGDATLNDTNGFIDVFVRNTSTGVVAFDTAHWANRLPNAGYTFPSLSSDGRFLAYLEMDLLNPTTAFQAGDIYWRDLQTGTSKIATLNYNGLPIHSAAVPVISPNGRFIAYHTISNVWASDNNNRMDVYAYDSTLDTNIFVSTSPRSSTYDCTNAVFSPDSTWVVFQSVSPYLSGTTNSENGVHLYARNLVSNTTVYLGIISNSIGGNCSNPSFSANSQMLDFDYLDTSTFPNTQEVVLYNFASRTNRIIAKGANHPSLNADGTKIAYVVNSSTLSNQVYVQTVGSLQSNLVSVATNKISLGNGNSANPILSPDGRFVIFTSTATNLVTGDKCLQPHIFVRDLVLSNTIAITGTGVASPNYGASNPLLATDGRTIVFQSFSTDLAPNVPAVNRNLFSARINAGDSDHDGMDDDWEMTYFGDLSHDGTADTDGDGMTDLQEFRAGTNPINNASVLRCLAVTSSAGGATIYWSSVPGQNYQVQVKEDLNSQTWGLFSAITATNEVSSIVDSNATFATQRFYRVVTVSAPPPPAP